MGIIDLDLPRVGWQPRPHQNKLWQYLMRGGKRAVAIWHRRAGKDEVCLHATAIAMMERIGNYWTCLPEYAHARRAIWTAVNPHTGQRRLDEVFPHELRANFDEGSMFVRLHNGSTYSCIGSDNYNSTMGASCAGLTMSEYALSNPSAWAYFRPMLEENNGWAAFVTTPRGRNHAFDMFNYAKFAPGWFCEKLTVRDTRALTNEQLDVALKEMQALYGRDAGQANFDQEYMCDWAAGLLGSFYQREMKDLRDEDRIRYDVEAIEGRPVHRAWDLGIGDDTSIWWFQPQGAQIAILDHYAASGVGLEHYAGIIRERQERHGWIDGTDYVPHDAKVREWGSGRTRIETMVAIGLHPLPVTNATLDDGINAVRRALPLCVFHARCEDGGITALEQYRREWDDERKCFKPIAVHDWTSHPADAFRYLSLAYKPAPLRLVKPPVQDGWRIPPPEERRRKGIVL